MTSIIKSLLGKNRRPLPEEVEALDRANKVLQFRVEQFTKPAKLDGVKAA